MKANYGYMVVQQKDNNQLSVMHLCVYEKKPNEDDRLSLIEELENDPEFKIDGDYEVIGATQEVLDHFQQQLEDL